MKNNKYVVVDRQLINEQLCILLQDLETNEYIEINEESLQNKTSKTDLIIYKLVMEYLYNTLLSNNEDNKYIKNVTK